MLQNGSFSPPSSPSPSSQSSPPVLSSPSLSISPLSASSDPSSPSPSNQPSSRDSEIELPAIKALFLEFVSPSSTSKKVSFLDSLFLLLFECRLVTLTLFSLQKFIPVIANLLHFDDKEREELEASLSSVSKASSASTSGLWGVHFRPFFCPYSFY